MLLFKDGKPKYSPSTHNLAVDGNSLPQGDGASRGQYLAYALSNKSILNGITVKGLAINGQTYPQMLSSKTDVDNAFESGKRNILIIWEASNDICLAGGKTAQQAVDDLVAYIAGVKATRNWDDIIHVDTLPRLGFTSLSGAETNLRLEQYNTLIKNNWRSLGVTKTVEIRKPDSPFYMPDYSDSSFNNLAPYAKTGEPPTTAFCHLNDAGYNIIANMIEQQALRSIGVR